MTRPDLTAGQGDRHTRLILDCLSTAPDDAVGQLVEDVCALHGGAKALAAGPVPLSYPHIRRMAGDGSIPSLGQLLLFVRLAGAGHPFRPALIHHLSAMFDPTPEELVQRVETLLGPGPVTSKEAADALRQVLRFAEIAPGRYVRVAP